MHVEMPASFVPVSEPDFDDFLKSCPDYRRDHYANATRYYFAGTNKTFAMVKLGKSADAVFMDAALLQPHTQTLNA